MAEEQNDTLTEGAESETVEEVQDTEPTEAKAGESIEDYKARLARAEKKIERMKLEAKVEKKVESTLKNQSSELDETALDFLDVKGITDPDDIDVIEKVVAKTGMTVRQALKDEFVIAKLESNKAKREVANATPSATKRGGGQSNDIASAVARYEQTGKLPDDFALASQVVNAIVQKSNPNKPAWH